MKRAFVVGWPIAHSRSPLIHGAWLKRHGIDGEYRREAVPAGDIDAFLAAVGTRGDAGGNVTLPHKEAAFRAAARRTPVAEALGAANTLWLEDGVLCADNTDVHGFAANLDERAPDWRRGGMALVLGAGGAARAAVLAIREAGYRRVVVLNRTPERAHDLAAHFGGTIEGGGLDVLRQHLAGADLVVNATSAGLKGGEGLEIPWRKARNDAIATDLLYVPLVTPFLAGAAARGLTIVDGLGMLLHQAAPGFERWFGVRPEVDAELRALVVADIGG